MIFSFLIAKRYFLKKRTSNFVHIVSFVSLISVSVGTAAIILVLSVFNGFEDLILNMYNSYDPHIKITSLKGKTFNENKLQLKYPQIKYSSSVLEEKVLLRYREKDIIVRLKGVSDSYAKMVNFKNNFFSGEYLNQNKNDNDVIVGRGISKALKIPILKKNDVDPFQQINKTNPIPQLIIPDREKKNWSNSPVVHESIQPVGIFNIHPDIDNEYIFSDLNFAQEYLNKPGQVSAIEIQLKNFDNLHEFQKKIQNDIGPDFLVKNRLEQHEFLYKILNSEKLIVFLVLIFIMIIATFNIVGSLTILIIDKKKEIITFKSLGVSFKKMVNIFFFKSMLTVISGIIIGLLLGGLIALLQKNFGFISMGEGSSIIKSYPVSIKSFDFFIVFVSVFLIGALASIFPANILVKKFFK